jgi:Family of unknown function (DUF5678)
MTREAEFANVIDLSTLLKPYKGKWVILSEDKSRVLYSADTMEDAIRESEKFRDHPILVRVPDENTAHLL